MSKVYVNVPVLPTLVCEMTNEEILDHQGFDSLNNSVCKTIPIFMLFSIVNSHLWRIVTLKRSIYTSDLAK